MRTAPLVDRLRPIAGMAIMSALFVAAGGLIHLREWLELYRHVPASVPGAAVVRVGFPVNTGLSLLVAVSLIAAVLWRRSWAPHVVVAAAILQAGSLATLVATRTGSVLGWTEPAWTTGAKEALAVEIGAIVTLFAVAVLGAQQRRLAPRASDADDPPSVCKDA